MLGKMLELERITQEEYDEAMAQEIVLKAGIDDSDRMTHCDNPECGYEDIRSTFTETEGVFYCPVCTQQVNVEEDAALLMASSSRGTPRVANRILRRMRDFAQVYSNGVITKQVVTSGLDKLEIDTLGLERYDREILLSIINNYGGGPVGAETLAISIGESVDSLEDYYEPYLLQLGLLARTPRGRIVTEKGKHHLQNPEKKL